MSELQIKINIGEFDIFLQGEGELVYKVFSDIRQNGIGKLNCQSESNTQNSTDNFNNSSTKNNESQSTNEVKVSTTKSKKRTLQASGQLLKDLDLSGTNKSLKDFINEKKPSSNVQKTATFVYYLQNILNINEITIDHIFTCYKFMGFRIPNNLPQNLADTCSSKYGYIGRKDGKYTMTVMGNNYIEFDINKEN